MTQPNPAPATPAAPAPRAVAEPDMLLIFRLSGEVFALPVGCVNEILDPLPRTEVPGAPGFAPALINVRGAVAPLVDLRARLRMPPATSADEARIIVLDLAGAGSQSGQPTRLALTADQVEAVIEADLGALEPVPELGARWPELYLKGVVRHAGRLVVLLDPDTLFAPDPETETDANLARI